MMASWRQWALVLSIILFSGCSTHECGYFCSKNLEKTALVIGNEQYASPQEALKTPVEDAKAMKQSLKKLGYKVDLLINAGRDQMQQRIERFTTLVRERKGTSFFYYAGHGFQANGSSYLLPVDFDESGDPEAAGVHIKTLLGGLSTESIDIVVLDACRNDLTIGGQKIEAGKRAVFFRPKTQEKLSLESGLAANIDQYGPTYNTYIAFSTALGKPADDDSLYSKLLIETLQKENYSVQQVFSEVREAVYAQTKQAPWESGAITTFYLKPLREDPPQW